MLSSFWGSFGLDDVKLFIYHIVMINGEEKILPIRPGVVIARPPSPSEVTVEQTKVGVPFKDDYEYPQGVEPLADPISFKAGREDDEASQLENVHDEAPGNVTSEAEFKRRQAERE